MPARWTRRPVTSWCASKRESAFTGVLTKDGKPLANVSVGVSANGQLARDPREMPESVRTDAQGKYTYGRLLPGQYRIYGGPYTRVATVGDGETATVNLGGELGKICIHGRATPIFNQRAAGVRLGL